MIDTPTSSVTGRRTVSPGSRWDQSRFFGGRSTIVRSGNLSLLLYARSFMWFHRVADFREAEMQLVYATLPEKPVLAQHKKIISLLIGEGREIIRRIRANGGLIKPANGFSIQDIQSGIEDLENTLAQWGGNLSKSRKDEILEDLFHAAQ